MFRSGTPLCELRAAPERRRSGSNAGWGRLINAKRRNAEALYAESELAPLSIMSRQCAPINTPFVSFQTSMVASSKRAALAQRGCVAMSSKGVFPDSCEHLFSCAHDMSCLNSAPSGAPPVWPPFGHRQRKISMARARKVDRHKSGRERRLCRTCAHRGTCGLSSVLPPACASFVLARGLRLVRRIFSLLALFAEILCECSSCARRPR